RVSAVKTLDLTVDGYAMPLEFWVQTACRKLRVVERAVPRVYLDLTRSFGATLDDADRRLAHYQQVLDEAVDRARRRIGCGIEGSQRILQSVHG
ncbi:MAG: hypothetical protein ACRC1K_01925, partial [Planctomycetia bacterium]